MTAVYHLDNTTIPEAQSQVLTAGTALFFTYLVNFVSQGFITFFYQNENQQEKNKSKRKLLETSRVLFWFAIAIMFSIYPPFYYGTHSAIMSYLTLTVVIAMHVFCIIHKQAAGRSIWSLLYMIYHLMVCLWLLLALIFAYAWADSTTSKNQQ